MPLIRATSNKGPQPAKDAEMDIALGLVRTRKHARRTAAAVPAPGLINPSMWQKQ